MLVVLLAFVIGVVTTIVWFNLDSNNSVPPPEDVSAELPIFSFCELINNPEKYDDKIVRVGAEINMLNIHGYMIFDSAKCSAKDDKFMFGAVVFPNSRDFETIDNLIKENKPEIGWYKPVSVIARVKFNFVESKGTSDHVSDRTSFHFEILTIETSSVSK